MKKMTTMILATLVFFSNCTLDPDVKKVKIFVNPDRIGWYFIGVIQDPDLKADKIEDIKFNDSLRMVYIHVKDLNTLSFAPCDYNGNDLTERLKFTGVKTISPSKNFFEFYNPTNEELEHIKEWNAGDDRAFKIQLNGNAEFDKQINKP
ncbi:hypothetical protein AB6735_21650 [Mucilaginibacter sp. RCC_168]|uniref:hypothetical protein n=1 Tax=Mucilaginibacter sp. RCC_168 TaxID=3239221 RepID=UPI003524A788